MLSVNKYTQEYIDECRSRIDEQLTAYAGLIGQARGPEGAGDAKLGSAVEAFEPLFFNNMVLVLDHYFCHRSRTKEKKDGNPLNEVRVLCNSLMENDGILAVDKTIRLKPETSLLKYEVGDEIRLNQADFRLLSKGFFEELESKYL